MKITNPRKHSTRKGHEYEFQNKRSGGWRIGAGFSNFLVVEGSAWSRPIGRRIIAMLRTEPHATAKKGRRRKVMCPRGR